MQEGNATWRKLSLLSDRDGSVPLAVNVMIVEDEDLYRDMLRVSLAQAPDITISAVFREPYRALEKAPESEVDVALLDVELGCDMNGFELGMELRRIHPRLGIVLLSNYKERAFLVALRRNKLYGWSYLLKKSVSDVATLCRAILGVAQGFIVIDPELTKEWRPPRTGRLRGLTPRQLDVVALMAQGYSNEAIAEHLGIRRKSVENSINEIYSRLGLTDHDRTIHPRVATVLWYLQGT